jgi:uncharacterized protein
MSNLTYYLYKDTAGQYRWYLEAGNNRKIANGGEGYHNRQDCISAVHLVMGTNGTTPFTDLT